MSLISAPRVYMLEGEDRIKLPSDLDMYVMACTSTTPIHTNNKIGMGYMVV